MSRSGAKRDCSGAPQSFAPRKRGRTDLRAVWPLPSIFACLCFPHWFRFEAEGDVNAQSSIRSRDHWPRIRSANHRQRERMFKRRRSWRGCRPRRGSPWPRGRSSRVRDRTSPGEGERPESGAALADVRPQFVRRPNEGRGSAKVRWDLRRFLFRPGCTLRQRIGMPQTLGMWYRAQILLPPGSPQLSDGKAARRALPNTMWSSQVTPRFAIPAASHATALSDDLQAKPTCCRTRSRQIAR